jgi:hypothetical protein
VTDNQNLRACVTIKYDPNGNELWKTEYTGPVAGGTYGYDLVLDMDGNVFVTGESWGGIDFPMGNRDGLTLAYDPDGNQLWSSRYSPAGDWDESLRKIGLDRNGNVYVSGYAYRGDARDNDYITIKYSLHPVCVDNDADGYGDPASTDCPFPQQDCNDTDPFVNPGMTEIPGNGKDDDCNPATPPYGTPASVLGTDYERPSGIANSATLLLPFGAVLFLRILKRKG